jgi:hypothetical protein
MQQTKGKGLCVEAGKCNDVNVQTRESIRTKKTEKQGKYAESGRAEKPAIMTAFGI